MKRNIAVVAGGYSGESVISMQSVATVLKHANADLYIYYKVLITKEAWYYEDEAGKHWPVDKNDFSITPNGDKVNFDGVFIVIHGTPGEDGKLQGYFDMLDIPYTTCGSIVSALTFNKSYCNKVVKDFDIVGIATSVHLFKHTPYSLGAILEQVKLPVFVKPNEGGSSLGVSKVTAVAKLQEAVELAFKEDREVLIEEFIEGRELTIGAYKSDGEIIVLPPTEIISKNEFFDFAAKYTPGTTDEVTPAQISSDVLHQITERTATLYAKLNLRGIVRIDYILQKGTNKLFFLEVNTMPGQSATSLIPQQVLAAGGDLKSFYTSLLNELFI